MMSSEMESNMCVESSIEVVTGGGLLDSSTVVESNISCTELLATCEIGLKGSTESRTNVEKSKNVNVVTNVPFKLLEDLNMIETYNRGGDVQQFLVDSINRVAGAYAKCGATEIVILGCSTVLQIWVLEHLPSFSDSTKSFPRIIKWKNLTKRSLVPTEEDKQYDVVVEAIRKTAIMPLNDMNFNVDVETILTQQRRLLGENKEFSERISKLEAEMKLLKDDKGGKGESGSGKKDDKDDKEESGSRKKKEARGSKEESGSGKKEGDMGSNHNVVKQLFEVCTSVSNMDVLFVKVNEQQMRGHLFRCMKLRQWDHVIVELPHFLDVGITMTERSFSKFVPNHLSLHEDPIKITRHCNLVSVHSHLII
ncbi:Ulp1 peptidase [Trifolium repens]|nr:Ulp1 peptidase [Trifolium repens]